MPLPTVTLTRNFVHADGVFGELVLPDENIVFATMEDDWKDNLPGQSCIPAGRYICRRSVWHKQNLETFEVCDVPGRSRILFHPANTEEDVKGCIAPGMRRSKIRVLRDEDTGQKDVLKYGVVESRVAFKHLMVFLSDYDEFYLVVQWAPGLP